MQCQLSAQSVHSCNNAFVTHREPWSISNGGRMPAMRIVLTFALMLFAGCAHSNRESREPAERGRAIPGILLDTTNAPPGSVYNVKVYVIKKGDNMSAIA